MFSSLDLRHDRRCAGGDQDFLGRHFLAACKSDRVRACQLGALVEDRDVVICEGLGVSALKPTDLCQNIVAQHGPVEPLFRNVPAEHGRVVEVLGEMRAIDEQLLGHTAADHAGAADLMLLGDGDARAIGSGHARGAHAARAGADHE